MTDAPTTPRSDLAALWWFDEGRVAGFARPGFNGAHWFDLPIDEALLLGWIGKRALGPAPMDEVTAHVADHGRRIRAFYGLSAEALDETLGRLRRRDGLQAAFERLNRGTGLLSEAPRLDDDDVVRMPERLHRLDDELDRLEQLGFEVVVSLVEEPFDRVAISQRFELHCLPQPDLGAATDEQVHALASILDDARGRGRRVGVHCLAGIGRTSTMLLAAHLALGWTLPEAMERVRRGNPRFRLVGEQRELVHRFA